METNNDNEKHYSNLKTNLIHRLNRIEGQIRGIKKMIEEERDCSKILEQMSSIRSSVDAVGLLLVSCMLHNKIKKNLNSEDTKDYSITETMKPFLKRLIE